MKIADLRRSISKHHEEDVLHALTTPFGEALLALPKEERAKRVISEYPRPQLRRESFYSLNGWWDYAITEGTEEKLRILSAEPDWQGEILVPFSPETMLSGVGRQLLPGQTLWYGCTLPETLCKEGGQGMRLLLHFGAVDYHCAVYVGGQKLAVHNGGYTPFEADITDALVCGATRLVVSVTDESDRSWHSRGKQTLKRGGMFYTAQSGIWQTVWAEWVPECRINRLIFTPQTDLLHVRVEAEVEGNRDGTQMTVQIEDAVQQEVVLAPGQKKSSFLVKLDQPRLWSPEEPNLYAVRVSLAGGDRAESYFGMRCYTVEKDEKGVPRFCLNHRPYFLNGVLDQGYWPDWLYTAPSDEALIFDIRTMKDCGFNMLRKHVKVEAARWYYHCDRLGMIVWQDMVNGGRSMNMFLVCYLPTGIPAAAGHIRDCHYRLFRRADEQGRAEWCRESMETVEALRGSVSVAAWVPFNEGWGQFDARAAEKLVRELDPSRPVDAASGWFDQGGGQFKSVHNYFHPLRAGKDRNGRAFVLSEYGGYACHIKGHSFTDRIYGYRKYDSVPEWEEAVSALIDGQIAGLIDRGLCGAVYTQVSDVEEEVNGILTYDRKVCKLRKKLAISAGAPYSK